MSDEKLVVDPALSVALQAAKEHGYLLGLAKGRATRDEGVQAVFVAVVASLARANAPEILQRLWCALGYPEHDLTKKVTEQAANLRESWQRLHPRGQCTCGGGGECEWCMGTCLHCGGEPHSGSGCEPEPKP